MDVTGETIRELWLGKWSGDLDSGIDSAVALYLEPESAISDDDEPGLRLRDLGERVQKMTDALALLELADEYGLSPRQLGPALRCRLEESPIHRLSRHENLGWVTFWSPTRKRLTCSPYATIA